MKTESRIQAMVRLFRQGRRHRAARRSPYEELLLRQLEQRTVLSVSVDAGVDLASAAQVEPVVADSTVSDSLPAAPYQTPDGQDQAAALRFEQNQESPLSVFVLPSPSLEGSPATLDGQFVIPYVDGLSADDISGTVAWGDGKSDPVAGIVLSGTPATGLTGTFQLDHIYADNGFYTIDVEISVGVIPTVDSLPAASAAPEFGPLSATTSTLVLNVAPTLGVPGDQEVAVGATLNLVDIGTFTDPGFDNPLNAGGELVERFTYAIDWGDGSPLASGPAAIDVPGAENVRTGGSFDGSHAYTAPGDYTVTVTVNDDDGGRDQQSFEVAVRSELTAGIEPSLEGSAATLDGQFVIPYVDGLTADDISGTVAWGDGKSDPVAGIVLSGTPATGLTGTFQLDHIYADNGFYTIDVEISVGVIPTVDPLPAASAAPEFGLLSTTTSTLVLNVPPALTPTGDQQAVQFELLALDDIGTFTDPGFDNPLNLGGELVETFTFAIDWGDGSSLDSGPGTVDVAGAEGVLTRGSFDGAHTYALPGTYVVTLFVNDDDGGRAVATFQVEVEPLAFDLPEISVGASQPGGATAELPTRTPPATVLEPVTTRGYDTVFERRTWSITTPAAEQRLVLRVVFPTGEEGADIPLDPEVQSSLRRLFAELPNDRYRIYLIRADGTERLLLDVEVQDGRAVDPADQSEDALPRPPAELPGKEAPDAAEQSPQRAAYVGAGLAIGFAAYAPRRGLWAERVDAALARGGRSGTYRAWRIRRGLCLT